MACQSIRSRRLGVIASSLSLESQCTLMVEDSMEWPLGGAYRSTQNLSITCAF